MSMLGSPVYEGVPVAQRPPHQQIRCMTCSQTLEPEQRRLICHVCSSWMHDCCIETLNIGSNWKADMCLTCQQSMTRQLRVISAQEVKKGRQWNQDEWFQDLKVLVGAGTGYGITRNRDMNELELTLARALQSGLHNYRDAQPASTTDGETARTDDLREQPGEPTPIATATAPLVEEPLQAAASSAAPAGDPQSHRMDAEQQPPEGTEHTFLGQRTGVREERDARPDGGHADVQPGVRAGSFHSLRSDIREERMSTLENTVSRMEDKLHKILQAMQSGGPRSSDIRGPPPKARSDQAEEVYEKPPSYRRQTTPPQPMTGKHPNKASPQVGPDPFGMHKGTTPSPAYQIPEDSVWNQS